MGRKRGTTKMSSTIATSTAASLIVAAALCQAAPNKINNDAESSKIVYGSDDRQDIHEWAGDSSIADLADSTVALVTKSDLDCTDPNNCEPDSSVFNLETAMNLCASETTFKDQPTMAFCSGTLIDDDIVLTAGHCIQDAQACDNMYLVFNYAYKTDGTTLGPIVQATDVFECESVITDYNTDDLSGPDWATIKLKRSAVAQGKTALDVTECTPAVDDDLTIIGYPSGLPAKIIQFPLKYYSKDEDPSNTDWGFIGPSDTFGGNSGSGVFTSDGQVVGVHVRGNPDYVEDAVNSCYTVNTVAQDYTSEILQEHAVWASIPAARRAQSGATSTACPTSCSSDVTASG